MLVSSACRNRCWGSMFCGATSCSDTYIKVQHHQDRAHSWEPPWTANLGLYHLCLLASQLEECAHEYVPVISVLFKSGSSVAGCMAGYTKAYQPRRWHGERTLNPVRMFCLRGLLKNIFWSSSLGHLISREDIKSKNCKCKHELFREKLTRELTGK